MRGYWHIVLDELRGRGKAAAKAVYRRPVIGLAHLWRQSLEQTCFIGLTGSAGKTTSKELLLAMLGGHAPTTGNSDSNNQLYSVARTLVGTPRATRFCVQELGASTIGAFGPMLALLRPRVGVVTTIGMDHYTEFRTPEAVAREKGQLIAALPPDGLAVLNADDPAVMGMAGLSRAPVVTFGTSPAADFHGEVLRPSWPDRLTLRVTHAGTSAILETRLCGRHQATAVLAAVATATSLGVPLDEVSRSVSGVEPFLGRMSVHETPQGVTFLRDDWKAPLWSVGAAFQVMAEARAPRRVIILGSLSDSSGSAGSKYRRVVRAALESADHVAVVREGANATLRRLDPDFIDGLSIFESVEEAAAWFWQDARQGDLVLLKGSNKVDHLARIALLADREVTCWKRRCGRDMYCDRCPRIDVPSSREISLAPQ